MHINCISITRKRWPVGNRNSSLWFWEPAPALSHINHMILWPRGLWHHSSGSKCRRYVFPYKYSIFIFAFISTAKVTHFFSTKLGSSWLRICKEYYCCYGNISHDIWPWWSLRSLGKMLLFFWISPLQMRSSLTIRVKSTLKNVYEYVRTVTIIL